MASFPVGAGRVVPASYSVGVCRLLPLSSLSGGLVPTSDPYSALSIKTHPTCHQFFFFSFTALQAVGGGSIVLAFGDGGGKGIPFVGGGIQWPAGAVPWSACSIPCLAGCPHVGMVRSPSLSLRSSIPW